MVNGPIIWLHRVPDKHMHSHAFGINQTLSRARGKTAGPKAVHVDIINTYELELK